MVIEKDKDGIYAVLSDPNKKADISATAEEVPKLKLPENYEDTMRLIGVWTEPHTMTGLLKLKAFGGKIDYSLIETSQSRQFYTELFEKLVERV